MIFDAFERINWKSRQYDQSLYQFINASAWPLCKLARDWINKWCQLLPADKAFISRIKSKSDKQHTAALFELLIFAACKGASLDIRSNVVIHGKRTADFTIHHNYQKILLECTLAGNAMEGWEEKRKKDAVVYYIEQLESFQFYINVAFKKLSANSISKKDFLKFLQSAASANSGLTEGIISSEFCYCGQGWGLVITLIKKPESAHSRSLGYITQPAKTIDNKIVLFTALNDKKASKYVIDNNPYIICVGVDDLSAREEEFSHVLFGPNYLDKLYIDENSNGFFLKKGQPINTSVSGVLFCEHLSILGLAATNVSLWHNPYATNKIPDSLFPFSEFRYRIENNRLYRTTKQSTISIFELLGIDQVEYMDGLRLENRSKIDIQHNQKLD